MYKMLSYTIHDRAPGWPGNPKVSIQPESRLANGGIANMSTVTLFNHFGSHMDGPKHFNDSGPNLHQMPLSTFIFENPLLLDIPKSFGELVSLQELKAAEKHIRNADLLMIRSGFSRERINQPECYSSEGVGISAEACKYLIENFENLKAVAMDWISLASYAHLDEGILAHEYLLGKHHDGRYICIIEDLDFEGLHADRIRRVFSLPLMVEGIDSAPVTVLAELAE